MNQQPVIVINPKGGVHPLAALSLAAGALFVGFRLGELTAEEDRPQQAKKAAVGAYLKTYLGGKK